MSIESTNMKEASDHRVLPLRLTPDLPGCSCGRFAPPALTRREALRRFAGGFGAVALSALWPATAPASSRAYDLLPRPSQRPARAKRAIMLYMGGGPSQMDL